MIGGSEGAVASPPLFPDVSPPFDFGPAFAVSGGSHVGSLRDFKTNPTGVVGTGAFFPLIRSEKSDGCKTSFEPWGPNRPTSTTMKSSVESGPSGVGTECPANSAATVTDPTFA